MLTDRKLCVISDKCYARDKEICALILEYKELKVHWRTERKIRANLIRAFNTEIERLKTLLDANGITDTGKTKWKPEKYKKEGDDENFIEQA